MTKEELVLERKRINSSLDRWAKKIEDALDAKGIEHHREAKEGWGIIVVFEIGGKKVFSNRYDTKSESFKLFAYSDGYSCKSLKEKI